MDLDKILKSLIFFTLLFAPLYAVRFNIISYPTTFLEILLIATFFVWLVKKIQLRSFNLHVFHADFVVLIFLLAALISVFVSPDFRGALGIFKAYFVEPIIFFVILRDTIKTKKDWYLVLTALIFSGLWVSTLAIVQGLTGYLIITPYEAAQGRAHAVFNTANAVGLYVGPILMLAIGGAKQIQSSKLKYLCLISIPIFISAIFLTRSEGALIGIIVSLIAIFLSSRLTVSNLKKIGIAFSILFLIFATWFASNLSNLTPRNPNPYNRTTSDTLILRLCLWEGTRNLIEDNPIFGSGLSGFKELYSQKYFTCDAEPLEYPHNWILNFWTETGILGLLSLIMLVALYIREILNILKLADERKWLVLGILGVFGYWLVHGLVDVPYFKNDLSIEFWTVLALAHSLRFVF